MVVTKELVSGESFAYLGRNYRLKIIEAEIESVTICDEYLHININDKSDYNKKLKLIDAWYKKQAEHHFLLIMDKYLKIVKKEVNKISIKQMKTRWGSCNPKKAYINLNLELIKKHPSAIEYVILHEIAHLEHYNHDRNFYNYVASYMPDWQLRRSKLRDATHL
jgi:predicted metal-dependent hydrolase